MSTINIATAHKGIKYRLKPPNAPHQSENWERLAPSPTEYFTAFSVLVASLTKFEHYFLSRGMPSKRKPVNAVSADPSNLGLITSNHFLCWRRRVRSS